MTGHADEARTILRDLWDPMASTGAVQNRIAEATAHALLAIADALSDNKPQAAPEMAICPSRQSQYSFETVCMLPLGHASKHEAPNRSTW